GQGKAPSRGLTVRYARPCLGAVSSAGRAPARQAGGRWFEPSTAHSPMTRHAFRQAVEARDWDAGVDALADDVVFRSPVVFKPYEGKAAVSVLLRAVSEVFEDFRYIAELESEDGMAL